MAFPKGSGAAVIRRRRCRSAAPVGVFRFQDPVLFLFIIYLSHIPFINSIQKKAPRGLRPLPPVPGHARSKSYPIGFTAQDGPKTPPKTAQVGQDGSSCCQMASKMAPHGPRWHPRGIQDGPRGLQDGPRDSQDASGRAPGGKKH